MALMKPIEPAKTGRAYVDDLFTELCGKPFDGKVAGYKIALYLPKGEERVGKNKLIIAPQQHRDNEVLKANVGLVIALGPDAYQGDRFREPWCKIGDWVAFQRYETTAAIMGWHDLHIAIIPDDKIDMVVFDRFDVTDVLKRDLM